jgi:hypothetical protein
VANYTVLPDLESFPFLVVVNRPAPYRRDHQFILEFISKQDSRTRVAKRLGYITDYLLEQGFNIQQSRDTLRDSLQQKQLIDLCS